MRISGDSIKTKVMLGFGLAFSIVVFGVYLTYSSFTQLLSSVEVLSRPNDKLVKLQHTLENMATAESSIRAYTLTSKEEHFKNYLGHLDTIKSQIDSLRLMMYNNSQELAQADSISSLLAEKQASLERYVALKKQQQDNNYSGKAMREIASTATEQPLPIVTTIKQHTTTTITDRLSINQQDSLQKEKAPKAKENKSFFSRIFSKRDKSNEEQNVSPPPVLVPKLSVKQEIEVDTNANRASQVAALSKVRRILYNVQREANRTHEELLAKEMSLLQQDKNIMDQIRKMVHKLERHEVRLAALNAEKARYVAKQTALIMLTVGIVGLAGGIAFILLILRDITRSNSYKLQLIKARKEAVQLARAKEAFVANMSHEIRTPLNVVLGFSEQLTHTQLQPKQQQHLQAIQNAGNHLLHIVNDVLDLSKIEAGKLHIDYAPFNLPQLINEIEEAFKLKARTKGINLVCTVEKTLPAALNGDPMRLKQVLFNLVDNAIKFTDKGQVLVQCKLKSKRRNRVVLAIEVADTGVGIPMERVEHVFGEFNQADTSIIRKYGGTGLGLAISKKLIEMQQGTLSLRSTPGQGTTFSIVLPLHKATGETPQAQVIPESDVQEQQVLLGKRVLVIDDDGYSRTLCEIVLNRWGMHVQLASDGKTALQAVEQQPFDLILTDVQLPGMSGKAVAKAIRRKNETIPIIAVTANILSRNASFFAKTGVSDYLLKPFTEQEMQQKLVKALQHTELATEPPQTTTAVPAPPVPDKPSSLYDLSEMREFTGPDGVALAAVIEVLLADHRQNLKQLQAAVAFQDWSEAGNVAHKMLTAFKHLHAHAVTPALEQLEQLLHQENIETVHLPALVSQLDANVTQVLNALEQELKNLRTSAGTLVQESL
ncbi:ATP-binding protein [Pontibacter silvestris]|uniref:histidine kinase n=1 Tax=Pontibacter silvestris TaxID=2305183 RepID=A0ABW4X260_9BACT|nr:ATP-binding protein [Pontibacter silvestris]MCC9135823.1 response regulator [Pontibacter silvestris]